MSKRQSNTLYNYFKSPKATKSGTHNTGNGVGTPEQSISRRELSQEMPNDNPQSVASCITEEKDRTTMLSGSEGQTLETMAASSEDNQKSKPLKRSRASVIADSSDSDEDVPVKKPRKKKKLTNNPLSSSSESEDQKPMKVGSLTSSESTLKEFSFQRNTSDSVEKPEQNPVRRLREVATEVVDINSNWVHNNLEFLKPDRIKDANKNKPNDPGYDPKTLYVPESYLKDLTPAMRQWWELKSQHMDAVLFFKVGKFYELYHMDAVVGVRQLGFSYMKGEFAHSGFPESAYQKMTRALIEKGYKVARVEQTETPEMMSARCKTLKKTTKFDKVVKREICQISAKATCVYTAQMSEPLNSLPNYMYAICMKESSGSCTLGVCFVETSIGEFTLSQFEDDFHFSRLLSLFAEYPPALILTERGGVTTPLKDVLTCHFRDIPKENLCSNTQFYTACSTLEKLSVACYFRNEEGNFHWPEFFKRIADDCLPKPTAEHSIRCLGACMWYLKNSKIDIHVFSFAKFHWYEPVDMTDEKRVDGEFMILDSNTINNLNLLGANKGSLKYALDRCETPFGKRLLQRWICRPLCNADQIKERQKAVVTLVHNQIIFNNARAVLKKMPDLERQLTKIHAYGNKFLSTNHPDGRAIFVSFMVLFYFSGCDDKLLKKITQFAPVGAYVDLSTTLAFFKTAFDQKEAEEQGKIIPKQGVVAEYDAVENKLKKLSKELSDYLDEQCKFFGCRVQYFGTDKKRFQLEVPEEKCHLVTKEYQLEGVKTSKKPAKRYSTARTKELLAAMMRTEAERNELILDLNRRIFEQFSEKHQQFDQAIQCLTILDVLCSLADYARTYSMELCIPDVQPFNKETSLVIENGRYPCGEGSENFVPNDIKMGVEDKARMLVITGPNMGGKSTLMRQMALTSIMAQIGSFVPASDCKLTLINRVFTRIGAQDDLIRGKSTFYNELTEACSILRHATEHSLILIDELGRGTSTHDGNAVATAYLNKLTRIRCRGTFSTHYHSLVDEFIQNKNVQLGHMACMVENDDDPTQESVTFLYKLASGRCPKSYGFNAARLAGLDSRIVARGKKIAAEMEKQEKLRDTFINLCKLRESEIMEIEPPTSCA
nr:probable DNA mismatch repair protein Msh6 [Leptinotarsa decemlineata]